MRNLRPNSFSQYMKKTLYSGLIAAALLSLTLTSCGSSPTNGDDDIATTELPPLPAAPDSTKDAKDAKKPAQFRELNSVNATEDIKKMQPQM